MQVARLQPNQNLELEIKTVSLRLCVSVVQLHWSSYPCSAYDLSLWILVELPADVSTLRLPTRIAKHKQEHYCFLSGGIFSATFLISQLLAATEVLMECAA